MTDHPISALEADPTEGWVLLPREPAETMIVAATDYCKEHGVWLGDGRFMLMYAAMLAAAPPPPDPTEGLRTGEREGDETAWLIEETWTGFVHYVHKDYRCDLWEAEARVDRDRRKIGLSARMRAPYITKDVSLAMRFPTHSDAEVWLAFQPRFMSQGDQFQIREHMWTPPPEGIAHPVGLGDKP